MTTLAQNSSRWQMTFFAMWIGQAFSIVGSELVQFALIWWLTATTGSAFVLTMAMLMGKLPRILFGPFIGPLVDRWNRRIIMIAADGATALATVGLAVLFAMGAVEFWHVFVLMFVRAMGTCFHVPAIRASTSLMVPQQHLSRVQGINQLLSGGVSIVAAPLGALLLALLPMQGILAIDVTTAAIAIAPLLFIAIPQPERRGDSAGPEGRPSFWADFKAGLRYMWGWPGLLIVSLMAAVGNLLLNPSLVVLPVLVSKHFGGGAVELGWAEAAFSLGVVVGSTVLGIWGGTKRRALTMLGAMLPLGLSTLIVGLIPASAFVGVVGAMFVIGAALPLFNGPLMAIMQAVVAPEIQGRVFTLFTSLTMAMIPIGSFIVGPVADVFGVQVCYIMAGTVVMLMALVGFSVPAVLYIEDFRMPEVVAPAEPAAAL